MARDRLIRLLAALPGVLMLINGIGFVVDPAGAAEGLGMPLLDGLARSTQVGDFTSFFVACAIFVFLGAALRSWQWLGAGAILLGLAALFRTTAALFHGAEFATQFIIAELIMAAWLAGFAIWFARTPR